jgi:Aspartyl protease
MWYRRAAILLVIGMVLCCVPASEADSTLSLNVSPVLASPYQPYDLELRSFYPMPGRAAGFLLTVRINGGKPLRLVLDSGADLIVIGAKTARSLALPTESELELVGIGSRPARVGQAETVRIGSVSFRNCGVAVVEGRVVEGADGVIPLSLFSAFLLRLNLPGKTLGLVPYPREPDPAIPSKCRASKGKLMLVPTVLNGRQSGYVMLDTGAFSSAISLEAVRNLKGAHIFPEVRLTAGTGAVTGQRVSTAVRFAISEQELIPNDVLALDLSNLSRHYGLDVIGVLGVSALRQYVLTVDYRNGLVRIEPKLTASPREQGVPEISSAPLALR